MSYLQFLSWIIANAAKFKRLLELLSEAAALFTPAVEGGTLSVSTQEISLEPDTTCEDYQGDEVAALEAQAIEAISASPSLATQAVFDGSRIRKIFEVIGPLLPTLIKLFGLG